MSKYKLSTIYYYAESFLIVCGTIDFEIAYSSSSSSCSSSSSKSSRSSFSKDNESSDRTCTKKNYILEAIGIFGMDKHLLDKNLMLINGYVQKWTSCQEALLDNRWCIVAAAGLFKMQGHSLEKIIG